MNGENLTLECRTHIVRLPGPDWDRKFLFGRAVFNEYDFPHSERRENVSKPINHLRKKHYDTNPLLQVVIIILVSLPDGLPSVYYGVFNSTKSVSGCNFPLETSGLSLIILPL